MKADITLTPVKSSQIAAIGYDKPASTLIVQFKYGGHYAYANVTPEDYKLLMDSESVGKVFGALIKSNPAKYPFHKIIEPSVD